MPSKPKPTAAERAEANLRALEIKSRQAVYKLTAKLLASKDPVKRSEGLDAVAADHDFLVAGSCLLPLMEALVPNKKTAAVVQRGLEVLWDFLNRQYVTEGSELISNVRFLILGMLAKEGASKGLAAVSALLVSDVFGSYEALALRVMRCTVEFLLRTTEAKRPLSDGELEQGRRLFLETDNLVPNLAAVYVKLRATGSNRNSPELVLRAKDTLVCLGSIFAKDLSKTSPLVGDVGFVGAVVEALESKELQEDAIIVVELLSREQIGRQTLFARDAGSTIATTLMAQLQTVKASEVVVKALQEQAVAAAAAAGATKDNKTSKPSKGKDAGKSSKKVEKEEPVPVPGPVTTATLEVVLSNVSRLADVFGRLVQLEGPPHDPQQNSSTVQPAEPLCIKHEVIMMVVPNLIEFLKLPLPWALKALFARSASQTLGLLASSGVDREARRLLVRNSYALGPLLEVMAAVDTSTAGLAARKAAEKAMHVMVLMQPGVVDESILAVEPPGPYLKPEALLASLASDDLVTWQAALRLLSRLTSSAKNAQVVDPAVLTTLLKLGHRLRELPLAPDSAGGAQGSEQERRLLLVALCESVASLARSSNPVLAQAVGTEELVSCLTSLLTQGPVTAEGFGLRGQHIAHDDRNLDEPLQLVGPEHWLWESLPDVLTLTSSEAEVERVVPRARAVRALTAILSAGGAGANLVLERATTAVQALLEVDLAAEGPRTWETQVPAGQALLHDRLRLELLGFVEHAAAIPSGRARLLQTYTKEEDWQPHSSFQDWAQAPTELRPYFRLLSVVAGPIFCGDTAHDVVAAAIKTLAALCQDNAGPEGEQEAVVENLAGATLAMGTLVPLVTLMSDPTDRSLASAIEELCLYFINHGRVREEYWANVPTIPPEDPAGQTTKKTSSRKKLTPEEEARLAELASAKGRPDPVGGPTRAQWQHLLDLPSKDPRLKKDKCTPMLAMILRGRDGLLQVLQQAGAKANVTDERGRTPLMDALIHGNDAAAMELVRLGADVNAYDHEDATVLKCAFVSPVPAEFHTEIREAKTRIPDTEIDVVAGIPAPVVIAGQARLVRHLLEHGADPNMSDGDGNYPLHWALEGTQITTYDEGMEMTITSDIRRDVSEQASARERLLDLLLDFGADVNVVNKIGQSPLVSAIRGGAAHKAKQLLSAGASTNVADGRGMLPIHHACVVAGPGYDDLLQELLRLGDNQPLAQKPHQDMHKGKTAKEKYSSDLTAILQGAVSEAICPQVVCQRLYRRGDLLTQDTAAGYVSLHYACGAEAEVLGELSQRFTKSITRVALVRAILANSQVKVDVAGTLDGVTPLHLAAQLGDEALVGLLTREYGAPVHALDAQGMTPLVYALKKGHVAVAQLLLDDQRVSPCTSPSAGMVDALHLSYACRHPSCPRALLSKLLERVRTVGPNLNVLNVPSRGGGKTTLQEDLLHHSPLCISAQHGSYEALDLLVSQHDLDVNMQDGPSSDTALHVVCRRGDLRGAEILLGRPDVDCTRMNGADETPLHLAVQGRHIGIVSLLLQRDAVKRAIWYEVEASRLPRAASPPPTPVLSLLKTRRQQCADRDSSSSSAEQPRSLDEDITTLILEAVGHGQDLLEGVAESGIVMSSAIVV